LDGLVEQADALLLVGFGVVEAQAIFQPLGGYGGGHGGLRGLEPLPE
jgi:hypothetical protein